MRVFRSEVLTLALCYGSMAALAMGVNLVPVILTTLGAEVGGPAGLSNEQLGRIAAVTFLGVVTGILSNGILADRWGMRTFVVGGNLLTAAGLLLLGLARCYGVVLAAAAVIGYGCGTLDTLLSPTVCALRPQRRTAAMNWLHSFFCAGAVLTALLGSLALRYGAGWRAAAVGLALPPLVLGGLFVAAPLPPLVARDAPRQRLRDLVRIPFFLAALGAMLLVGAVQTGMVQWLPAYAETSLGYSKWASGLGLTAFSVLMGLGRLAVGTLAGGRVGAKALLVGGALFTAACYAGAGAGVGPAFGFCVLTGLAVSALWPTLLAVAGDRFPHGGASLFGILGAAGNIGGVLAPWGIGVLADVASLRVAMLTGAAAALLLAGVVARLGRRAG